jgi:nickel-type superoxide dismutase maturation protease
MFSVLKIQGESMYPKLSSGDFVVSVRYFYRLTVDDIVVFQHPLYGQLVKRIQETNSAGMLRVSGENNSSVSSKQIGYVKNEQIQGKVISGFTSTRMGLCKVSK